MYIKYRIDRLNQGDFNDYVSEIEGDVYISKGDINAKVGHISATILHLFEAEDDGVGRYDILEEYSAEVSSYTYQFFDFDRMEIKEEFLNSDEVERMNVLIIKHVLLNEKGRKCGLGLRVLKDIEFVFGKNKLIVMKPFPMQFTAGDGNLDEFQKKFPEMDYNSLPRKGLASLTKKLQARYINIGYKAVKGTGLVCKDNVNFDY